MACVLLPAFSCSKAVFSRAISWLVCSGEGVAAAGWGAVAVGGDWAAATLNTASPAAASSQSFQIIRRAAIQRASSQQGGVGRTILTPAGSRNKCVRQRSQDRHNRYAASRGWERFDT